MIWLFLAPLLISLVLFLCPILSRKEGRLFIFILSLIPLLLLISGHESWLGSTLKFDWIPPLSIFFHLHVDSLSLLFLYLTALIIPISLFAIPSKELPHPHTFYALIFLLQAFLNGFFMARDLALFVLFWEAMLLPLYFIITSWGGTHRQSAAIKFLIYMIAGSALLVAAALALYFNPTAAGHTFDLDLLQNHAEQIPHAPWVFAIFLLAFAVKTPLFPFHGWLPDAYCQAPAAGTILLAAILSKAGVYGILRIGMELFPTWMREWNPYLLGLAMTGVIYGALAAWRQEDFKRLIAYSSFSHVNFVLAGLFILDSTAFTGGILQALNHGITIAALFLVAWWLEKRIGTTSLHQEGGLAKTFPWLCWLTLFFVLSSVALPGMNNFIGEFFILFGLFASHPWLAALLGSTMILSVIYMLRWMEITYFGTETFLPIAWKDIGKKELLMALPLVLLILAIGIYPMPLINLIAPTAEKLTSRTGSGGWAEAKAPA